MHPCTRDYRSEMVLKLGQRRGGPLQRGRVGMGRQLGKRVIRHLGPTRPTADGLHDTCVLIE
jgi:hypothetical protein